MQIITKLFLMVLACAVITFAQTSDSTKQASSTPAIKTQQKAVLPTGTLPKAPTNWSKIKDLFL